jgi:hypothetical protein
MPIPAIEDLAARFFRELTDRELQIGQVWMADAYNLVLGRLPQLEAHITAGTVSQDALTRVVCAMVGRVFSNPEGKDREAIDDYSYNRSVAVASGLLHVTPAEIADLTPGRATNRSVRVTVYGE